jgi:hypothetical protein
MRVPQSVLSLITGRKRNLGCTLCVYILLDLGHRSESVPIHDRHFLRDFFYISFKLSNKGQLVMHVFKFIVQSVREILNFVMKTNK